MIRKFDNAQLNELSVEAQSAKRLRAHLNVHTALDANVQRLFIATEPDTYMRPHRHTEPHKWEFFVVLKGCIDLIIFSDSGEPVERIIMSPDDTRAIEVPPNTWHCYVCMTTGTLALEVKEGAYIPTAPKDFAPWAPEEYSSDASVYLESLRITEVNVAAGLINAT